MRQDQLALATGVGRRFLIELEGGKPSCQLGRSLLVAQALGLSMPGLAPRNAADNRSAPGEDRTARLAGRHGGGGWPSLPIYFESRLVGNIDVDKAGPGFTYDPRWIGLRGAFPISLTMPLRPERVSSGIFLPWAANLLPENEQLRTLGEILGMARSDVIGLLSTIGGETAGALSFGQPGRTGSFFWRPVGTRTTLNGSSKNCRTSRSLVGDEGVSMSLAGAQTKLAVAVDGEGQICVPTAALLRPTSLSPTRLGWWVAFRTKRSV